MSERETWATRTGFLIAAIGSAVGLGNIWQFPFKTAANGGAAFVLVYLVAVAVIGFPALLAEFVLGRRTNLNAIEAFGELGHRQWRFVGALAVATGFWILSYYSVVGGWVSRYLLRYVVETIPGLSGLLDPILAGGWGDPRTYFGTVAAGPDALLFHVLFMGITVAIVALGIQRGIEAATKLMVPSIVVLMVVLAGWAATLAGGGAGYGYFLSPDLGSLAGNAGDVIPFAVGQAFFTLSLGMGIMITYSSYVGEDDDLAIDGATIVVVNTLIGILAGLVVFPILFANGVDPAVSGPSAIFIAIASAFAQLPLGNLLGILFFLVVLIAALSSAISLLEVVVSYGVDAHDLPRAPLAAGLGGVLIVLGAPSAWDTDWLTWFDTLAYKLFLPLSVLYVVILVVTVLADDAVEELQEGGDRLAADLAPYWIWGLRTVVLLGVVFTLGLGMRTLFIEGGIAPPL